MSPWGSLNLGGNAVSYSWVKASSYANLPSIAAEDTIGLITSETVTDVFVSNDRPAGRPTGEVRIKMGSTGQNVMNILANPIVSGYPVSVYRYNGSAWVMLEAYIRKSAQWKIIRAEFYKDGAVGMIGTITGFNTGAATVGIGASAIQLYLSSGGTTGFTCAYGNAVIDVTNYSAIKVSYTRTRSGTSGTHKARIYLNPTLLTGTNAGFSEGAGGADLPIGTNTISFDVSAIAGSQLIHIGLGKSSYTETDNLIVTQFYGE